MSDSPLARALDGALEATVVGSFTKLGYGVRSTLEHWQDPTAAAGRVIVITGATSGLGLAAARRLSTLGATVHLVGRNEEKLRTAKTMVESGARAAVTTHQCDLSLLANTDELAASLAHSCGPIDVLVHNAGSLLAEFTLTGEGVETTLATHLLCPYRLTERLMATARFATNARVITMTSGGMYTERFDLSQLEMTPVNYKGTVAYARAKRAQSVLSAHWQRVYGPDGLSFHLVHPGWAATPGVAEGIPGFSRFMGPLLRSPEQGADTTVWLAGLPDGEPLPGQLWLDRHPRSLHKLRRTRLSPQAELAAEDALPIWCDERIARALAQS